MRMFRHYFSLDVLVLFLLECLIIQGAFLVAASVLDGVGGTDQDQPLIQWKAILAGAIVQMMFVLGDLYDPKRVTQIRRRFGIQGTGMRMLQGAGLGGLVLGGVYLMVPGLALGGIAVTAALLGSVAAILAVREVMNRISVSMRTGHTILITGSGPAVERFFRLLDRAELATDHHFLWDNPVETSQAEAPSAVLPDRVVVVTRRGRGCKPSDLLDYRRQGISVESHTRFLERTLRKVPLDGLSAGDLAWGPGLCESGMDRAVGRACGVVAALGLLTLTFPLLMLTAILIKMTSKGPVLFTQDRVGEGGKVFRLYKFRTMTASAPSAGARWATQRDNRVTGLGRVLRTFRIDELPQAINVLRGDMAFVGPRPEQPQLAEKLARHVPYYRMREVVRPGITGWAQINMGYAGSIEESREKLMYDLYYVKNRSLFLDAVILVRTVKVIVLGRGAR